MTVYQTWYAGSLPALPAPYRAIGDHTYIYLTDNIQTT